MVVHSAPHHRTLWPIQCEDTKEIIANYALYIQSNHWKRIKILFKHSPFYRGKCYVCGAKEKLDLHHKTYEHIGHEGMDDLQELCEGCHGLTHQLAMTGKSLGITIGNAADAMLGEKEPGTFEFTEGGWKQFHDTSHHTKPKRNKQRRRRTRVGEKRPVPVAMPDWGVPKELRTTKPSLYECRFCHNVWQGILTSRGIFCPTCKVQRKQHDVRLACSPPT